VTCGDVTQLLDAFVDGELPTPMLLAVARHAGGCAGCERAAAEVSRLHDAVEGTFRADAEALDLSTVWPALEAKLDRVDTMRNWRRRLRSVPAWGAAVAVAAAAVFWLRTSTPVTSPTRVVQRPNHMVIDRLEGAPFQVRRERKQGTTVIWVMPAAHEISR
jgi:anti-sigma factor RsiW